MNLLKFTLAIICFSQIAFSQNIPYPDPEPGYKRVDVVIPFAEKQAQDLIGIEVGIMSKSCNAFAVLANLDKKIVDGWGHTEYLVISSDKIILGTRQTCEPLSSARYIPARFKEYPSIIFDLPKNYPSKLPYTKVLYVPEDFVVKVKFFKQLKEESY